MIYKFLDFIHHVNDFFFITMVVLFTLRVWRENRERLVGFPGRHHAYNATKRTFMYDSQHACELSLVLTGGAFFHKVSPLGVHRYFTIKGSISQSILCSV